MNNITQNKSIKPIAKRVVSILGIVVGVLAFMLVFLALTRYFLPLLLAIILTTIMEPLIRLFTGMDKAGKQCRKFGLPRSLAVIISMVIVCSLIVLLLLLVINGVVSEVTKLAKVLPSAMPSIYTAVSEWITRLQESVELPQEVIDAILSTVSSLGSKMADFATGIAGTTVSYATSLPSGILFVVFTVMSTYFWATGRHSFQSMIVHTLPHSWIKRVSHLYETMISALLGYIKAQLIIMSAMAVLLAIGFAILGVDYVILLALLIAFADALPIVGTGLILLPWGVYNLLFANLTLGIGLLVLYLCAIGLRQIMEPKVLSQQIGLHPLLTMSAMYAGFKAMGFLGMLFGPLTVIIIKYAIEAYLNGRTMREYLSVE